MEKKEAVIILKEHIDTYRHQLTEGGWKQMTQMGIASNNIRERLDFREYAMKQIQAYKLAINALEI